MIHPQIRNCGTETRRPAGNDPNVLQVSKKDGQLRKVFVAGPYPDDDGPRVVVSADYSNQELVITACESRDPTMLAAFQSTPRKDIHSLTSTGYAHILLPRLGYRGPALDTRSYEGFMAARRNPEVGEGKGNLATRIRNEYSKAVNFLIAYLGGYTTLAGNLLIPPELAKELMNSAFKLYSRLKPWQQETIQFALSNGYTLTAYGNRAHATRDLWSSDDSVAHHEQRSLVNAVIQGTAADILKKARQEMKRRRMLEKYKMRSVKPVYDEMTASVPLACAVDYAEELAEVMTITPPGYPVGMQVEVSIGWNWGKQEELGVFNRQEAEALIEKLRAAA
jgi:DNA polymerase-1